MSGLNRVAAVPGWVITASSTEPIKNALDTYANPDTSIEGNATTHALLTALGEVDGIALLNGAIVDEAALEEDYLLFRGYASPDWGSLNSPSRVVIAYARDHTGADLLKVGLYYANTDRVEENRAELAQRLSNNRSLSLKTNLCSTAADAKVVHTDNTSVIVATCATTESINWFGLIASRDLLFLIRTLPGNTSGGKPSTRARR